MRAIGELRPALTICGWGLLSERQAGPRRCKTLQRAGASPDVATLVARAGDGAWCWPRASRALDTFADEADGRQIAVETIQTDDFQGWDEASPDEMKLWARAASFKAKPGDVCLLPSSEGGLSKVLLGVRSPTDLWAYAALPSALPSGHYSIASAANSSEADGLAVGWGLGTYSFSRYKAQVKDKGTPKLCWPDGCNRTTSKSIMEALFLARDMINTPAEDMGPEEIAAEAAAVAQHHGADVEIIVGDDLLTSNYPAIHTVGRASTRAPRLVDIRWTGPTKSAGHAPKVALVGKGVAFDTGGLDIKPAQGMRNMKKDMGGAALMLALAHVIMANKLPVSLRVLIPTVENSISGNAYRPLDVLQTRSGITVENGNTDAEGRLILCDAMYEAAQGYPDLLIDAATLTGAARVALGPSLPALFSSDDDIAAAILQAGESEDDPLWRLPLHSPYRKMLDSKVADTLSASEGGLAGAITAALFLQQFVKNVPRWVHIDTNGYNTSGHTGPGRPEGGEALALRALWRFLKERYTQ